MRFKTAIVALVLTLACWLPGCGTRNAYLVNRGGDVVDILRIHGMFGPGIAAKAEVTRLLQFGFIVTHNSFAGGLENRAFGGWRESLLSWGLFVGQHSETLSGIDRYSGDYGWSFGDDGDVFYTSAGSGLDLLTFRVTGMFILGLDVDFRFGELLDFVAGIFQFDPSGDDIDPSELRRADLPEEDPAPEPAEPDDDGYDFENLDV